MKRITRQNMTKLEIKLLPWHWCVMENEVRIYTGALHSNRSKLVQIVPGPRQQAMDEASRLVLEHDKQL